MENKCSECDGAQNSSNPVSQTTSGRSVGKISSAEQSFRLSIPIRLSFREDVLHIFVDGTEISS